MNKKTLDEAFLECWIDYNSFGISDEKSWKSFRAGWKAREDLNQKESLASDLEVIKNILDKRGILYDQAPWHEDITLTISGGYSGFFTLMTFSSEGILLKVEAYE